jgi:hypothetical protein
MEFPQISDDEIQFFTEEQGAHFATITPPQNPRIALQNLGFGTKSFFLWRLIQEKCAQKLSNATVNYETIYPICWIDKQGDIRVDRLSALKHADGVKIREDCSQVVLGLKQKIGDIKYIQLDFKVTEYQRMLRSFNGYSIHTPYKNSYRAKKWPSICQNEVLCHRVNKKIDDYFLFAADCNTSSLVKLADGTDMDIFLEFQTLEPRYNYSLPTRIVGSPVAWVLDVVTFPLQVLGTYLALAALAH